MTSVPRKVTNKVGLQGWCSRCVLIPYSGPSSSSYRSKYSHIIGSTENVEKVEKPVNKSFGLVSASLKRDRRTIEETQIAMREKKMKLKPS